MELLNSHNLEAHNKLIKSVFSFVRTTEMSLRKYFITASDLMYLCFNDDAKICSFIFRSDTDVPVLIIICYYKVINKN